jgi:aspartate kinase
MGEYLKEVKNKIAEGATTDYTASRGEYLNGLILAHFLDVDFVDAAEVIKFDRYGYFDSESTKKAICEKLGSIERAVIPGFYGAMPDGSIKTFSRGGSDITGSIVARDTKAVLYENWTDVSGFLMADPRIVDNPKPIEEITYKNYVSLHTWELQFFMRRLFSQQKKREYRLISRIPMHLRIRVQL